MIYRALLAAFTLAVVTSSFAGEADARRRFYGAYGYEGYYPGPDYIPPRRQRFYPDAFDIFGNEYDDTYYDPYYDPPIHKIKPRKKKAAKNRPAVSKKTVNQPLATPEVSAPKKALSAPNKKPLPLEAAVKPETVKPDSAKLDKAPKLPTTIKSATATELDTAKAPARPAVKSKNAISCDKASSILTGYGFSAVKPTVCSGRVYAFDAARDGKAYAIKLNATNGELTEVRKVR